MIGHCRKTERFNKRIVVAYDDWGGYYPYTKASIAARDLDMPYSYIVSQVRSQHEKTASRRYEFWYEWVTEKRFSLISSEEEI